MSFGLGPGVLWGSRQSRGSRRWKTLPVPGSLSTVTSPFIARASLRLIASPRPVPVASSRV